MNDRTSKLKENPVAFFYDRLEEAIEEAGSLAAYAEGSNIDNCQLRKLSKSRKILPSMTTIIDLSSGFTNEEIAVVLFEKYNQDRSQLPNENTHIIQWAQAHLPDWYKHQRKSRRIAIVQMAAKTLGIV